MVLKRLFKITWVGLLFWIFLFAQNSVDAITLTIPRTEEILSEMRPDLEVVDRYLTSIPSDYFAITSVEQLKSLITDQQAVIVDVRESAEYQAGHIPNAINIPLRTISRNLNKIPKDRPVILYCSTGYRSSMGVMTLHLLNYENVQGFPPSLSGWTQAGGAIVKS
jgi:rhodanese-related sulfurtransferase